MALRRRSAVEGGKLALSLTKLKPELPPNFLISETRLPWVDLNPRSKFEILKDALVSFCFTPEKPVKIPEVCNLTRFCKYVLENIKVGPGSRVEQFKDLLAQIIYTARPAGYSEKNLGVFIYVVGCFLGAKLEIARETLPLGTRKTSKDIIRENPSGEIIKMRDWIMYKVGDHTKISEIFELYDEIFLDGYIKSRLVKPIVIGWTTVKSTKTMGKARMKATGDTEIRFSPPLIEALLTNPNLSYFVGGIECRTKIEGVCLTMEHEMVHVVHMIEYRQDRKPHPTQDKSHGPIFKEYLKKLFGHIEHKYSIVNAGLQVDKSGKIQLSLPVLDQFGYRTKEFKNVTLARGMGLEVLVKDKKIEGYYLGTKEIGVQTFVRILCLKTGSIYTMDSDHIWRILDIPYFIPHQNPKIGDKVKVMGVPGVFTIMKVNPKMCILTNGQKRMNAMRESLMSAA